MPRPRRIGSGNQFKKLAETKIPHFRQQRGTRTQKKRSGSHNSKEYQQKRNEVRKAQTRINAMQKQLANVRTTAAKKRIQAQIDSYKNKVESTRTYSAETGKRIRSKAEVSQNVSELAKMNVEYSNLVRGSAMARQRRANIITQEDINQASLRVPTQETPYTKTQVQIFYRATQKAWQNAPLDKRNEAIMSYYGVSDLRSFFEGVVSEQRNLDVQKARELINDKDATDEQRAWAMQVLEAGDNGADYQVSYPESSQQVPDSVPVEAPNF